MNSNPYEVLHQSATYGTGGTRFRKPIAQIMQEHGCVTVLDYGCGKGGLVKSLQQMGIAAYGFDPAVLEYLMMPVSFCDMIVTTDVLEHIEEVDLPYHFSRFFSLGPKAMLHVVSNRKAAAKLPDGRNAHLTVKPPEWWTVVFRTFFPAYDVSIIERNEQNNFTVFKLVRHENP